jgi:hypothetical protein
MTNSQTRLTAASIALLAGAVAAGADNLDVNVGIAVIIVSGAISSPITCGPKEKASFTILALL